MTFSLDGQKLAVICGYHDVYLLDPMRQSKKIHHNYRHVTSVMFLADGGALLFFDGDRVYGFQRKLSKCDRYWVGSDAFPTANQLYELGFIDRWVTVNQTRTVWLSPARQASAFATSRTKIAIGSPSGVVTMSDLDLKLMETYMTSHPSLAYVAAGSSSEVYTTDGASVDDSIEHSDIEDEDENGSRPQFSAAKSGSEAAVKMLLGAEANANARNNINKNVLQNLIVNHCCASQAIGFWLAVHSRLREKICTTAGDLGLTAEPVEKELGNKPHLASTWDCVLLLDEADVFLAQRIKQDLQRNALVSGR